MNLQYNRAQVGRGAFTSSPLSCGCGYCEPCPLGGDMEWQEAGTLQEMQTVVLLADLLKLVLSENDKLNND